ncbi:MAG: ribonuclease P protein component [Alphaproteobacteria bacterium]|nr:ribonuclease P protein component [Alphaproteobacteria bacterium]
MHKTQVKRIVKAKQFSNLKKNGDKLVYSPFIILYIKDKNLNYVDVGFITSSKIGNAVVRNKVRRRLKNIAMSVLTSIDTHGFSICVIGRSKAFDYNFAKMKDLFAHAIKKVVAVP